MGYITTYTIKFVNVSAIRLKELISEILSSAYKGIWGNEVDEFDEYVSNYNRDGYIKFNAKWYDFDRDILGCWLDGKGHVIKGLLLIDKEVMYVTGEGEDWEDVWRAVITARSYCKEKAVVTAERYSLEKECEFDDYENGVRVTTCTGCPKCGKVNVTYSPSPKW